MAHESILRGPLTILGTLADGSSDDILTISSSGVIGSIASSGLNFWKIDGTTSITAAETNIFLDPNNFLYIGNDYTGTNYAYLQISGNSVILGSKLGTTAYTDITSSDGLLQVNISTGGSFRITDNSTVKTGVEYAADYTATLTTRSLIDKGFADSRYWKTSATTTLSENVDIRLTSGTDTYVAIGDGVTQVGVLMGDGVTDYGASLIEAPGDSALRMLRFVLDGTNTTGYGSGMLAIDERISPRGIEYGGDYTATFTARSLVDKAYVDSLIGSGGWTLNGTTNLTGAVTINTAAAAGLQFTSAGTGHITISTQSTGSTGEIRIYDQQGTKVDILSRGQIRLWATDATFTEDVIFSLTPSAATFEDSRTVRTGIEYIDDYSADFTDRSLIDKAYVDTRALSGTYTPTLTNTSNIDSSTAFPCQYMRVNNTVTVSGRVDVDPTAANSIILGISLPIASNFANVSGTECAGVCANSGATMEAGAIYADDTNNRATLTKNTTLTTSHSIFFTFTYQVI